MVASGRARVLLYTLMPTQWKTMRQVARVLRDSTDYEPVVFFDRNGGNVPFERDLRACLDDGIAACDEDGPITPARIPAIAGAGTRPRPLAVRALHGLLGRTPAWDSLVEPLVAFPESLTHLRARGALAGALIDREQIRALVVPGDSTSYDTPAWIRAARKRGVPSVIVPFSTNTAAGTAADLGLLAEHDARRWFNRPLARLAPKWIYDDGTRRLVRESTGKALAAHVLGLDPPRPWVLHSGHADAIVADSAHVRDELIAQGLPADRIEATGALADDQLAAALRDAPARREALYRELDLPAGKPMVLGSLCDYSRYFALGRAHAGFHSANELIEFWVQTLVDTGHNAVLSLHPWMRYDDWRHLERIGARISRRPIEELVPLCELFLVSVSVTVRLAIACGTPVVNHDALAFRIGDYADAGGVFTVEDRDSVTDHVQRLAKDASFAARAHKAQAAAAPLYGTLDGNCGARFLALLDRLTLRER